MSNQNEYVKHMILQKHFSDFQEKKYTVPNTLLKPLYLTLWYIVLLHLYNPLARLKANVKGSRPVLASLSLVRQTALIKIISAPDRCFCKKILEKISGIGLKGAFSEKEKNISMRDDNFFFDYQYALRIYQLIKDGESKKYYILSRVDEINCHPVIIEKWAKIGLKKSFWV